jgi:DNA polymerase I-like protein with 3'-5' exonuclease and polymerase domains
MIMQVHYELIFEVAAKDLEKAQTKIVGISKTAAKSTCHY